MNTSRKRRRRDADIRSARRRRSTALRRSKYYNAINIAGPNIGLYRDVLCGCFEVRGVTVYIHFDHFLRRCSGALKMREWKMQEWKNREQIAGVENAGMESAGVDCRGIANDEWSRYCYCVNYVKNTKAALGYRPTCLTYVVSKNCIQGGPKK